MPGGKGNIQSSDGKQFSSEYQPENRRKPVKFLTDLLTKELADQQEILMDAEDMDGKPIRVKVKVPNKEVIVKALLKEAANGNMIAIKEVFDRTEGKAMQPVEMSGEGGVPLFPTSVSLVLPTGMDVNFPSNTDGDESSSTI